TRPVPDWATAARWNEPVVVDPPREGGRQFFGGDLDGITEHLDYIAALGADVVYLTPVFPGRSNHRYDAHTFSTVDPVLGGDEALRRLTAAAHARGIRVLGDFTSNHTGVTHEWFVAAQADPQAPERHFYFFDDDGGYAAWLGVPSLPKLDHSSPLLRQRLFEDPDGVVRRWLGPAGGLDGWRVDVANMTGRHGSDDLYHEVAREMRRASVAAKPDALVIAEHCHDVSTDLTGDGWHGVMNYAGFTRPVWTWLTDPTTPDGPRDFLGQPVRVPRLPGSLVAEAMVDFSSRIPWSLFVRSFILLGSHDTSRIHTLVGGEPELVRVAAGLLFTMPGIPMVCYGDEIGMRGRFGEDGRRPMPWPSGHPRGSEPWDESLLAAYRELASVRRESVALRRGGMRWVYAADDALVFVREAPGESVLVHVARAAHGPLDIELADLPGLEDSRVVLGHGGELHGPKLTFDAVGPQVSLRSWNTPLPAAIQED
ncbi:MAG: glycoside hydrolase family 13 protein, partial [Candidatus Phosphoribacter sp.]